MSIVTSYFQNGQLVKILPADNCNQYTSRYIISDGQRFDLELASDIANIPIPIFNSTNHLPNISKSLDYVIYRKAGDLELKGLFDLSIICLRKANELMSHSPIHWNKRHIKTLSMRQKNKEPLSSGIIRAGHASSRTPPCGGLSIHNSTMTAACTALK